MRIRRFVTALCSLGLAGTLLGATAGAANAATHPALGTRSLAEVLTSDGNRFDHNWYDYDIVTEAVLAVLAAKPDSKVGVLADGSVTLTAFIPNDRAFQVLTADLTHRWYGSEERVLTALADKVGIDAIEAVLLYHVVPGARITANQAAQADGAALTTALGSTIRVRVLSKEVPLIVLRDKDPNDINPYVNPRALDINKGNRQLAHGIIFVLRPLDL